MALITEYSSGCGLYLVAESIDFGGKGSIISAIKNSEEEKGKRLQEIIALQTHENPRQNIYRINY